MKFKALMMICLAAAAMALQAGAEITHRYTFEGNPNDVVGGAHGTETAAGGYFEAPDYSTAVPPGAVAGAPQQSIEFGMNKAVTNKSGVYIPSGVFGTASGSCSLWLRPDEGAKFYALNATGFKLMSNNGTTLTAKYDNGPTSYNDVGTSPGIPAGEWVHALVTWDVATSNMAYYVNGTLAGSVTNATDILDNAFHIGGFNMNDNAANFDLQFVGLVYDLQFYDQVLSAGEVAQLSANPGLAIVPEVPALTHRYAFNDNADDALGTLDGTMSAAGTNLEAPLFPGDVPDGADVSFASQSIQLGMTAGSASFANFGSGAEAQIHDGKAGSYACWIKASSLANNGADILSNVSAGNDGLRTRLMSNGSVNQIGASPLIDVKKFVGGVTTGAWHHLVVMWDDTTGTGSMALDGVVESFTFATNGIDATDRLMLGNFAPNANALPTQFAGQIYDLQIYDGVLPAYYVGQLFSNPGTAVVSAPPELAHRYVFENDATDSVGGSDGTESGNTDHLEAPQYTNVIPDNAVAGAPAQSLNVGMNYGSKKSGITVPGGVFSTNSGSYSVWLKADAWVNNTYMLNVGGSIGPRLSYASGLAARYNNGGAYATVGTAAVSAGEWVHAAVTWDTATSNMSFYVDGALVATQNDLAGIGDGTFSVGSFNLFDSAPGLDNQFKGQIYDLQFYDQVLSTGDVAQLSANPGLAIAPEVPELPPAGFESGPIAISSTEIWMTAVEGSGLTEPVEYLFTETSGNPGGSGSGWQTSSSYTDGGLTPDTLYSYTVVMRDAFGKVSVSSAPASATTLSTDPAPASLPALAGKVVAIWSKGVEKFVRSSEMNGGVLRADRKSYEEEGRFLGVAEAGDTVALLDMTQDCYVTHTNGRLASAAIGDPAARRFTLVDQGSHYYAIQAGNGKYVRADGAGELVVDAVSITDDALFALVPVRTGPNVVVRAYEGWEADFHSANPADFPVNKVNIGMLQMTPSLYTDTQLSDLRAVWNTDAVECEFILPYSTTANLTNQVDNLIGRIRRVEGAGYRFEYGILYHEILAGLPGGPWSDPRVSSQEEVDLFRERVTAAYNAGLVNEPSYKVFAMPYQFASNSVMGFSVGGVPADTPIGCDAATLEFIKNNFDGMFLEVNGHDYAQRDEDADAAAAAVWCRDNGLEFGITSGGSGKDTAYKTMYGNIFAEMETVGFDASWEGMHYVLHHVHQPVSDRLPEWTTNTTTENSKWLIEQVMSFETPAISAIDTDGDGIADLVEIRAGTSPLEGSESGYDSEFATFSGIAFSDPGADDKGGYDDWAATFSGIDLSDPVADDDNDGVDNLLEYALGGNPVSNDAAAVLPVFQTLENVIVYVHNERTDDTNLAYTVQLRTNLVSDVWKTNGVEFVGAAAFSNVWKTVTNQVPILGKDQQFIRLKVERAVAE